ncbi:pyrroline-5-carboxylate reductase [Moorella sp. E306M]|jgi:pyrroline-5-carboxylate reductase|uniref:pyrroline-5-carboxylate reductase n=1 Tax=Moorella sp. E306M TaxID=2572683 RepID=UPI0010FFC0DF|nr:pyrroline-5-carboxylate reductase [Moorella sp. E306M]GEA17063.1 pyrroline-5-carboxylate reductase [Moorella sp. E306M]
MEGNIGFLGAGAMGEALIRGLLQSRQIPAARILAWDIRRERLQELEGTYGLQTVVGREELAARADILILAVKPQNVKEALGGLIVGKEKLVISIIAGVTLARLASYLGEVPIVRVVPNTPALVGEGMTALAANKFVQPEALEKALAIFRSVGRAIVLPEEQLNAVTGLSGSGPAYIYMLIEALADGGVRQGLARSVALELAAQTVLGAARMVLATGEHPGVLKDKVTSPAGTTIAGLTVLEDRGVRGAIIRAVEAATLRAESLSKE